MVFQHPKRTRKWAGRLTQSGPTRVFIRTFFEKPSIPNFRLGTFNSLCWTSEFSLESQVGHASDCMSLEHSRSPAEGSESESEDWGAGGAAPGLWGPRALLLDSPESHPPWLGLNLPLVHVPSTGNCKLWEVTLKPWWTCIDGEQSCLNLEGPVLRPKGKPKGN